MVQSKWQQLPIKNFEHAYAIRFKFRDTSFFEIIINKLVLKLKILRRFLVHTLIEIRYNFPSTATL